MNGIYRLNIQLLENETHNTIWCTCIEVLNHVINEKQSFHSKNSFKKMINCN